MAKSVKELNVIVGDLHKKFESELSEFKKSLKEATSPDPLARGDMLDSLIKRVGDFELSVMQQLQTIQIAIERLEEREGKMEERLDRQEQRTYRNELLIHGLEERDGETRDKLIAAMKKLFKDKLDIEVEKQHISDCYRLGRKRSDNISRPVVVRFTVAWMRDEVFINKSKFKGSKVMCTEMLTKYRLEIFKKCAAKFGRQCWTSNGTVIVSRDGQKRFISTKKQLNELIAGTDS